MELNPLGAIGLGLMSTGGSLSPEVYQQNANLMYQNQAQAQQKKQFMAELLTKHYQQGTLAAESYRSAMEKLGFQIPEMTQPFDTTALEGGIKTKLDQGDYLGDAQPPGLGGPSVLRTPDAPTPQPGQLQLKDTTVLPKKPDFYSIKEINSAVADFEKSLPPSMSKADRYKRLDAFKKDLATERKSQLEESTKLLQYEKEKREAAKPQTQQIPVGKQTWEVQFDPDRKLLGERLKGNPDFAVISKGEKGPLVKVQMADDPTAQMKMALEINPKLEAEVKPMQEDLYAIRQVRQLLATDSGVSNQKAHELLTGMFSSNRATNMLYSKNTNFGSLANRMASAVSQFATGKFNEETRRQIREMLDEMQNKVIVPTMRNYEAAWKKRAKSGGVNPELINLPALSGGDESSNVSQSAKEAADKYLKKFSP